MCLCICFVMVSTRSYSYKIMLLLNIRVRLKIFKHYLEARFCLMLGLTALPKPMLPSDVSKPLVLQEG